MSMYEPYDDEDDLVNEPDIEELIYRCAFTEIAYCKVGGHFLIIYADEAFCPMGCND